MHKILGTFLFCSLFLASGCATVPSSQRNSSGHPAKDAQTAIGTIANTIKGEAISAKYCPVCGRHYSSNLETCPKDGALLKEVQD